MRRHLLAFKFLAEGMREGDLADLVLPLISVDEYASKVDQEEAIVFGFYVHDKNAANDLNRFLQKSAVPILDTEVSPSPDQHGYFMVFVELMKNSRLAENVADILAEMKGLVDIDEWQMRLRDQDDLVPFSTEALAQAMRKPEDVAEERAILDFLCGSLLESAHINDAFLILEGRGERHVLDLVAFDAIDQLMASHQLNEAAISCEFHAVARTNRIARLLGERWQAVELDGYLLLHNNDDERGLLLR